jgi:protein-tyrosine-phosphatase
VTATRPSVVADDSPAVADAPVQPAAGPPAGARLLVLCTGNAARSVMVGYMLGYLSDQQGLGLHIVTRGTHTIDGQPVSLRTRAALTGIPELAEVPVNRHRSRQLHGHDLDHIDLVVGMEADHIRYLRRHHPEAAPRAGTLRRLVADLEPSSGPLAARLAALHLADVAVADTEDVEDPAGREDAVYRACAGELWRLCQELAGRL